MLTFRRLFLLFFLSLFFRLTQLLEQTVTLSATLQHQFFLAGEGWDQHTMFVQQPVRS